MGGTSCRWGCGGHHVPVDVRDAVGRAACRGDGDARTAQHARAADSVPRRRGDVRGLPRRDGGCLEDHAVPRDVRRQLGSGGPAPRGRGHVRGVRDRRLPRRVTTGEDRRSGAERQRALAVRRHDALLPGPVRQLRVRRALDRPRAAGHGDHRRRARERGEPHRRHRRSRRRCRAHRGGGDLLVRRPVVQGRVAGRLEHRSAGRRDHRRRVRRVPSSQLQSGAHHHGRRRARCCSDSSWPR